MNRLGQLAIFVVVFLVCASCCSLALSPCDYVPEESDLVRLTLQGDLRWFDDAFRDNHTNSLTGTFLTDFTQLFESPSFGYRLDGKTNLSLGEAGPIHELNGSGNFKRYFQKDYFSIGAIGLRYTQASGPEIDVTGGIGVGRFRDVTPLAKAIRIQNTLLDEGILIGPLTDETLQELAQQLGQVGLSLSDKLAQMEKKLLETGLVKEGNLGARGLLQIEQIITASEEARLCGWDIQVRVGLAATGFPSPQLSEALVLNWNYARVPDPVSQWRANAQWITGLSELDRFLLEGTISYGRRIRDNWKIRTSYQFTHDQMWNASVIAPLTRHQLSLAVLCQLSAKFSLAVDAKLNTETGYEEPTKTLTIHLSYDVF